MTTARPDQARVIAYRGGLAAVAAVPGAGKTFVLKELAARLIEDKLATPSQLLMLTYMRTGATNLRDRIKAELAFRGRSASGLRVMTIHAFCHQLLQRHAAHLIGGERNLISEPERWMFLNLGLELFLSHPDQMVLWMDSWASAQRIRRDDEFRRKVMGYSVAAASDAISAAKAYGISESVTTTAMLAQRFPEVAFLIGHYARELTRRQMIDYDDLVAMTIALLDAHPELLARYQRQYRFVLEDEAQDSTFAQQRLLLLLTAASGNLLRVGDTNQAILSTFTFNDPKYFREFLHQADRMPLEESGRSAAAIQNLANRLVEVGLAHPEADRVQAFERQTLKPSSMGQTNPVSDPDAVRFWLFDTPATQDAAVVAEIQARLAVLQAAGEQPPLIGVLTRSNDRAEMIGKMLASVGIDAWLPGRAEAEADVALIAMSQVLRFLCLRRDKQEGQLLLILRILDRVQNLRRAPLDDLDALLVWSAQLRHRAVHFIYPELPVELGGGLPQRPLSISEGDYRKLLDLSAVLKELMGLRHRPLVELLAWTCERLFPEPGPTLAAHRLALSLRREYYRQPDMDLDQACDFVEELCRKPGRLGMISGNFDEEGPPPAVMVATVHKAKGMEFDTVFVLDVTAANYPWIVEDTVKPGDVDYLRKRIAIRAIEGVHEHQPWTSDDVVRQARYDEVGEGMRLLYVAITRAKSRLVMSAFS
ncbi:MAG: ATP-dependent helicase, partial [Candidatus Sericytochromatia bacterium]|nr:ATP-dependent helicase [Candidatus Sericytochromatia bacterium]